MGVALEIIAGCIPVVEASVGGRPARLLVDTGAGLEVFSPRLADALGLERQGTWRGERMSREVLTVELVEDVELSLGGVTHRQDRCGVHDVFDRLPPALGAIDGALSLRFLGRQPFTLDYPGARLTWDLPAAGSDAPLDVEVERGLATSAFTAVTLDGRIEGRFLVDTGASLSVVDLPTMARLGVRGGQESAGTNETGHPFRRVVAPIRALAVGGAVQEEPSLCFEAIRHDGALGGDFLRGFAVGLDVAAGAMRLAAPAGG
jgi:predicted aspartyl protease